MKRRFGLRTLGRLSLPLLLFPALLWPVAAGAVILTQITFDPADDSAPVWSPDGTKLSFSSARTGNSEVWVMDPDGTDPRQLTFNSVYDGGATWSPDGQWLVYDSTLDGASEELYRVPAAGGQPVRVTYNSRRDMEAAWGFAGSWVVCHSWFADWEVAIYDGFSGVLVSLVTDHPAHDVEPDLAPDMVRVAFQSNRSGDREIWIAPIPAGQGGTRVTHSPGDDIQPDWSAAHGLIAFTSGRLWGTTSPAPGGPLSSQELSHLPLDIWITNEDGSFTAAVTTDGLFNAGPNWSPDGQRIAFHSYRNGNWDIFIADDLPIIVPVEPATWGRVKAGFRGN